MLTKIQEYHTLSDVTPKWFKFHSAIQCPVCKDTEGHAGVFPLETEEGDLVLDEQGNELPGVIGYCVKCNDSYYISQNEVAFDSEKFQKKQRLTKESLRPTVPLLTDNDIEQFHLEYRKIYHYLVQNIEGFYEKSANLLSGRGYSKEYSDYLLKEGWGVYQRVNTPYIRYDVDNRIPCLRGNLADGSTSEDGLSYLYHMNLEGLLIPLKNMGQTVGFRVRNASADGPKYRTWAVPSKYMSRKQREGQYMPVYTYLNHDLPEQETYNSTGDLFITEGEAKAHAIKYFLKKPVIGVCGIANFTSEQVKDILLQNHTKTLVICPDLDYKHNYAVSNNTWKLMQWASDLGFNVKVLEWSHPDQQIFNRLKGIDDALLESEIDDSVSYRYINKYEFFVKMSTKVRQDILRRMNYSGVKVGQVLTEAQLEGLKDFVTKDDSQVLAFAEQEYTEQTRLGVMYDTLAKHKLVCDISPTGSGKSHALGLFNIEDMNNVFIPTRVKAIPKFNVSPHVQLSLPGIDAPKKKQLTSADIEEYEELVKHSTVKRVIHISQSPINSTVSTIVDNFQLKMGRNAHGWTFDASSLQFRKAREGEHQIHEPNCPQADNVIKLREQRQVIEIRKEICNKCPLKKNCEYLKEIKKVSKATHIRQSWQSLSVKTGDVIAFDDFGSMEHFVTVPIDGRDVATLFRILEIKPKWRKDIELVKDLVTSVLKAVKSGKRGRHIFEEMHVRGSLKRFPIAKWLTMDEPDRIPFQKIKMRHTGEMEFEDEYAEFSGIKRWFFLLLDVLRGNQLGDIYYDVDKKQWVVKGVDPKYKEAFDKAAAVMVLDATANKDYIRMIFGVDPFVISAPGNPLDNITVKQVVGFQNTHKSTMFYKGGSETKAKIDWVNKDIKDRDRIGGVISFKSLFDQAMFKDVWDPNLIKGWWFFSERASNVYYQSNVNSLYVMGVPIPNLTSTAAEVDNQGDISTTWVARPYGPVKEDGSRDYIIQKDVASKELRDLLWYKRCACYIQAIGRLRSLRRPDEQLEFTVLDNIALPFPVNEVVTIDGAEKKHFVDMSTNELFRQTSYIDSVLRVLQKYKDEHDDQITINNLSLLSKVINLATLSRYGVEVSDCVSFSSMMLKIQRHKDKVINNPALVTVETQHPLHESPVIYTKKKTKSLVAR